jgi:hypothetical protein
MLSTTPLGFRTLIWKTSLYAEPPYSGSSLEAKTYLNSSSVFWLTLKSIWYAASSPATPEGGKSFPFLRVSYCPFTSPFACITSPVDSMMPEAIATTVLVVEVLPNVAPENWPNILLSPYLVDVQLVAL